VSVQFSSVTSLCRPTRLYNRRVSDLIVSSRPECRSNAARIAMDHTFIIASQGHTLTSIKICCLTQSSDRWPTTYDRQRFSPCSSGV